MLSPCEFEFDKLVLAFDELLASDVVGITPAVERLMGALRGKCCAPEEEFAVEAALRESLANAVIHGNRLDAKKKIRLCCACQADGGILIIVKDEGEGFDPAAIPSPLVGQQIHSEHGRGIFLINLLMDEVRFKRGGTEIHIRKSPAGRRQH